jgi:hypothetical protein
MAGLRRKPQLLDAIARPAAILNHAAAFGIGIASLDLHLLIAGNAGDKTGEKVFRFFFGFDSGHGGKRVPSNSR